MALKLLSLNIERDNHIPKIITLLKKERPEVTCFQEICEPDFEMLKQRFGYTGSFFPMLLYPRIVNDQKIVVKQGIAFLSTLPILKVESFFYVGNGAAPLWNPAFPNGVDRVLVLGKVKKDNQVYHIAITHFTWAGDGGTNPEQSRDVQRLLEYITANGEMVLCGDFNSPRGGEIHVELSRHLKDNIPLHIKTTIDPKLHRAGALQLVVDHLWSTPRYTVRDVKVIEGVSDHMAVIAEIEKLDA